MRRSFQLSGKPVASAADVVGKMETDIQLLQRYEIDQTALMLFADLCVE